MSSLPKQKTFTDSYLRNLSLYAFTAIICGALTGYYFPEVGRHLELVSHYFFVLLEVLIVPIIFIAVTYGVSYIFSIENAFKIVGRMILYFLAITSVSILLGLAFGLLLKPGADTGISTAVIHKEIPGHFLNHPNNPLQISNYVIFLLISISAGVAIGLSGAKNKLINILDEGKNLFFKLIKYLYIFLPIVIFCNIAFGISVYGINTLLPLSKVVATVYLASLVFIFGILGLVTSLFRISLWDFLISIKEEIILVVATSSSKTAFPIIFDKMESQGYDRKILRFVIPLGYNFNLAGACIYLSISCIFLVQFYNISLGTSDYIWLFIIISMASKTASGVPGSGFLALMFTLSRFGKIPVTDLALLYSVDRFMNEARSVTNFIGIAVSAAVISKLNQHHKDIV
ncbi:cation:dicarboxylase symporter family transporter [Chryseobacterium indologenes]|uniref:cation:dicarboxylate symporter family transporter n=1 Tax=Chryseobacterium indologenes TaxID=253 RepID=UPI0003E0648A|nr:cation:dicarboxylase symporter family transporter [Chryseobacterium indologenes]QPQ52690.1 cation:dicarboxylase symporter family transporter [Chryseobacterium indologenes]GAE65401.1 putative C4-dicarboxylate transporter [Chryseobacterium indologenes NBRC 14944]SFK12750.1 aerobic C4-dicarboxylate transport protein [Chryseobacterium indologenes]SUX51402.1 Aerobic C4-dicarboxylate transport protein [Chryseobacterium indologenes]